MKIQVGEILWDVCVCLKKKMILLGDENNDGIHSLKTKMDVFF